MSTLYPQLRLSVAARRFEELHGKSIEQLASIASSDTSMSTYSPIGGRRATSAELCVLRERLLGMAADHGFPGPARMRNRNAFDRSLGIILHDETGLTPGEASLGPVWAFLALSLLPDVCAWRFPPSSAGALTADRFKAGDLTRHTLARTWTRAHVLRQPKSSDPYNLLKGIAEADLDQIMARRRSVAASPQLVRAVVYCHQHDESGSGLPPRTILRDSLMRLLRILAFIDVDVLHEDELRDLVQECRAATAAALTAA